MMMTRGALTLACLIFFSGLGLCSIVGDVSMVADAWFRMSNFKLLTAVSLWTATFYGIAKIRMWGALNPALAKSLSVTIYSTNAVCLALVTMHFAPEMEALFDFIIGIFERIF